MAVVVMVPLQWKGCLDCMITVEMSSFKLSRISHLLVSLFHLGENICIFTLAEDDNI